MLSNSSLTIYKVYYSFHNQSNGSNLSGQFKISSISYSALDHSTQERISAI
jgi:hypothetical protein